MIVFVFSICCLSGVRAGLTRKLVRLGVDIRVRLFAGGLADRIISGDLEVVFDVLGFQHRGSASRVRVQNLLFDRVRGPVGFSSV